jgi:hypothetical protein
MNRKELLNNYMNKEFLKQNLIQYGDLISNDFHSETRFKKNPNLILDRFDIFIWIMNMIKNRDFESLRNSVNPMTPEFLELNKQLRILEDQMFRG